MNISFTLEDDKVKGVNITINLEDKFIKSLLYCSGQKDGDRYIPARKRDLKYLWRRKDQK